MNYAVCLQACLVSLLLVSCGGGGGSAPPPPQSGPGPVPTISFSTNVALLAPNQNALLTWTSDGTSCTATGDWSGSKAVSGSEAVGPITHNSTFSLSCTNNGSAAATSSVKVDVSASASPPPAPTSSHVDSNLEHTYLDYSRLSIGIRDIIWDSKHQLFYAVTRPDSSFAPSSVVSIDPITLATQVESLVGEPWCLAISSDGTYLYVGFKTGGKVQRLLADGLIPDITITTGGTNSWVRQVRPSPLAPRTVAVAVNIPGTYTYGTTGVLIADDATIRSNSLQGMVAFGPAAPSVDLDLGDIAWNADATRIYGDLKGSGGFVELAVNSQGLTPARFRNWPLYGEKFKLHGDEVRAVSGRRFSLTNSFALLGWMADWFLYDPGYYHVWSDTRGKVFSSALHHSPNGYDGTIIYASDPNDFTVTDSITFNGAATILASGVVPWGTDGIAVVGQDDLFVASGPFAAAGGTRPPPADAMLVSSNAVLSTGTGGLGYRILDAAAYDVAATPCGELYVSTAGWSKTRPNSVVEVNLEDASIMRSVYAGSEPFVLATSDDCSTLYAAHRYSNSVTRIRLSDMTVTDELPINPSSNYGDWMSRADSMSVAPGQPQTVAIAKGDMDITKCGGSSTGLVIFDGATRRPVPYDLDGNGIKAVAWGNDANVLYGENWTSVFAFNVDASGANNPRAIMPFYIGTSSYDLGRDLYFDPARNRLFNTTGHIYDVSADMELNPLVLLDLGAITAGCGTPTMSVTTDRTSGKIFWVSETLDDQISVTTYDGATLERKDRMLINGLNIFDFPMRVVRPTSDTLAIVTAMGYVVIVKGAMLEP